MMTLLRRIAWLFAGLATASCGGGGGGDSSSPPPPPSSTQYVTVSPATVVARNVEGGTSRGALFLASLTAAGQAQFSASDTVYIILASNTTAITDMSVTISGTSGQVNVIVDSSLAEGTYSGNIRLQLCKDAACNNQVSVNNIPFSYEVLAPVARQSDALELSFVRYQDQAAPSDTLDLDFTPYGSLTLGPFTTLRLDSWNPSNVVEQNNSWVDIDFTNDAITGTLADTSLPCGNIEGAVEIRYGNAEFEHQAQLPIRLTVGSLPVVESVQPNIGFTDRASDFLVVGCGFDSIDPADLVVGGVTPTSVSRISDREIEITLPAGMTAGSHDVGFSSQAAPSGAPTGQLLVKQPQPRPDFAMTFSGTTPQLLVWDEKHERLYLRTDAQEISMLENTGTEWTLTTDVFSGEPFQQMLSTADGNQLILLRTSSFGDEGSTAVFFDAVTLARQNEINMKEIGWTDVRHVIDKFGRFVLAPIPATTRILYRFHSMSGTFMGDVEWPDAVGRDMNSFISQNRDVIYTAHGSNGRGWYRLDTTDDSITIQPHLDTNFIDPMASVSATGALAEFNANSLGPDLAVFDVNMAPLGSIALLSQFDDSMQAQRVDGLHFEPTGNTVIASYSDARAFTNPLKVRYEKYDLNAAQNSPYQPIESVDVTGEFERWGFSSFFISADGQTVFRIGNRVTIMQAPF